MGTTQYTVRHVPERLDVSLRHRAKREGRSLNSVVLDVLAAGSGLSVERPVHHDLDDLIGTWVDDPAFGEAVEAMDQVDTELWGDSTADGCGGTRELSDP